MLRLAYKRHVYLVLTRCRSCGTFAPDLFQKDLRFGGLEIKRRILEMNASAKPTLRVLHLPYECYVYLRNAMSP